MQDNRNELALELISVIENEEPLKASMFRMYFEQDKGVFWHLLKSAARDNSFFNKYIDGNDIYQYLCAGEIIMLDVD